MKSEKILQIIKDYNSLYEHAEQVISKLCKLDNTLYTIARGIENIQFDYWEETVHVQCDDSWNSCYDTHYFSFPFSFLSMTDDELEKEVLVEKQKREEEERIREETIEAEQKAKQEAYERATFERLKKKFENDSQ